jgi:hypothetical protein
MVVVTGIHRGGTTFLGELLHASGHYAYLHEPLNARFGIEGVDRWYPQRLPGDPPAALDALLERLHAMDIRFKAPHVAGEPWPKRLARRVVKSRGHLDLLKYRWLQRQREVLVKDPFFSLCAGSFAARHDDVRAIFVVRHPAAVFDSVSRMGWQLDPALADGDAPDDDVPLWRALAGLWVRIYSAAEQAAAQCDRVLLVKHESLCTTPLDEAERILHFLGRPRDRRTDAFIRERMFAGTVTPAGRDLHVRRRDAGALAQAWKRRPKPEHALLAIACGALLETYYGESGCAY